MDHFLTRAPDVGKPAAVTAFNADPENLSHQGDITWMLTSSALVLIMTPGLAFFYGGMVSADAHGSLTHGWRASELCSGFFVPM